MNDTEKLIEQNVVTQQEHQITCMSCSILDFLFFKNTDEQQSRKEWTGYLYNKGWRYFTLHKYQIKGPLCPTCCYARKDDQDYVVYQ